MSCRLGASRWWLAAFAALLCGAGGALQPSVPQVCWFAEMPDPVQPLSCSCSPEFPPSACSGSSLAEELLLAWLLSCLTAPWAVSLRGPRRVRVPMAVPGDLTYPWWKWAGAWGWRAEHPAAKLAQLCGKTSPWFLEMSSRCFIPAGLSCSGGGSLLSWKGDADQSPGRHGGRQGGIGGCSWVGQLSGGTASAGEGQGTWPRAVSSLASPIQDCLVLPRQCLMYFLVLLYLVIEIVSN